MPIKTKNEKLGERLKIIQFVDARALVIKW